MGYESLIEYIVRGEPTRTFLRLLSVGVSCQRTRVVVVVQPVKQDMPCGGYEEEEEMCFRRKNVTREMY